MSEKRKHQKRQKDEDDGLHELCPVCGQYDAMYLSEGDFLCESTGEVYTMW